MFFGSTILSTLYLLPPLLNQWGTRKMCKRDLVSPRPENIGEREMDMGKRLVATVPPSKEKEIW
jgi:hypothetical protein